MRRLALPHRPETVGLCHNFSMMCRYTYFVHVTLHKKAVSLPFASLGEFYFTKTCKRQVLWLEIKSTAGCACSRHFRVACQTSRKGRSLRLEAARCGVVYSLPRAMQRPWRYAFNTSMLTFFTHVNASKKLPKKMYAYIYT